MIIRTHIYYLPNNILRNKSQSHFLNYKQQPLTILLCNFAKKINKMRKFLITVVLCICIFSTAKSASTPEQVKTLLVFNFMKFMEWEGNDPTIKIAFIGKDEALFKSFKEMTEKRTVGGKKIILQKISDTNEVSKFHLVYLAESNSNELSKIKASSNTVVVTEKDGLGEKGSFINLVNVQGKLRFEINKDKFKTSSVKISNQLLALAILV